MIQVVEGVPLPRNLKQNFCHLWQIEKKWLSQDTPDKKVPNYGCCARDIDIHMCMSGLEGAGGQQLPPENCNALAGQPYLGKLMMASSFDKYRGWTE